MCYVMCRGNYKQPSLTLQLHRKHNFHACLWKPTHCYIDALNMQAETELDWSCSSDHGKVGVGMLSRWLWDGGIK